MNRPRQRVCTRAHLADVIYKKQIPGVTRAESRRVVDEVIETMADAIIEEGELKLINFGVFAVREKKARMGRNVTTGKDALIRARRVISFYPASDMKEAVADAPVSSEAAAIL